MSDCHLSLLYRRQAGWLLPPKHRRSWLSLNQQKYHILLIPTTLPFSYFLGFFLDKLRHRNYRAGTQRYEQSFEFLARSRLFGELIADIGRHNNRDVEFWSFEKQVVRKVYNVPLWIYKKRLKRRIERVSFSSGDDHVQKKSLSANEENNICSNI